MQLGAFVQIKILSPETPQVATEEQYTCEPVEDLRYLSQKTRTRGKRLFVLTLSCCSRSPSKVLAELKKKKRQAPSTDK